MVPFGVLYLWIILFEFLCWPLPENDIVDNNFLGNMQLKHNNFSSTLLPFSSQRQLKGDVRSIHYFDNFHKSGSLGC